MPRIGAMLMSLVRAAAGLDLVDLATPILEQPLERDLVPALGPRVVDCLETPITRLVGSDKPLVGSVTTQILQLAVVFLGQSRLPLAVCLGLATLVQPAVGCLDLPVQPIQVGSVALEQILERLGRLKILVERLEPRIIRRNQDSHLVLRLPLTRRGALVLLVLDLALPILAAAAGGGYLASKTNSPNKLDSGHKLLARDSALRAELLEQTIPNSSSPQPPLGRPLPLVINNRNLPLELDLVPHNLLLVLVACLVTSNKPSSSSNSKPADFSGVIISQRLELLPQLHLLVGCLEIPTKLNRLVVFLVTHKPLQLLVVDYLVSLAPPILVAGCLASLRISPVCSQVRHRPRVDYLVIILLVSLLPVIPCLAVSNSSNNRATACSAVLVRPSKINSNSSLRHPFRIRHMVIPFLVR